MTFVVLVIFGFGVILISSALEGVPLLQTFQGVLSGKGLAFVQGKGLGGPNGGPPLTTGDPAAPPKSPPVAPTKPGPQQTSLGNF